MNPTIEKFGYPSTLVREFDQWLILLRPAQVTFGSLVLASKSEATAFSQIPSQAFSELPQVIGVIERALTDLCAYQRINYLMLMMVDPNVHFHVIPRYDGSRTWNGMNFVDHGWPGPPALANAVPLSDQDLPLLTSQLRLGFTNIP